MQQTPHSKLVQARNGDPDAWRDVWKLYTPLVLSWARQCGLDDTDAEDVTADLLGTLPKLLAAYDPRKAKFRTWLRQATKYRVRDLQRRAAVRRAENVEADRVLDDHSPPDEITARNDLALFVHQWVTEVAVEPANAQVPTLDLGKEMKGTFAAPQMAVRQVPGFGQVTVNTNWAQFQNYLQIMQVKLKAGQPLEVTANVVGDARAVGLAVLDPTGQFLAASGQGAGQFGNMTPKTAFAKVGQAPADGKYIIIASSDRIGPFTVVAKDPSADDDTPEKIKEKIEAKKQELKKVQEEIDAFEKKLSEGGKSKLKP